MRIEDVAGAARLHACVFPDYFLTHMGPRFLEGFYGEFVGQPGNYGLVATCDQGLIGCVIGTLNSQACYERFYRHNLGMISWTVLQRLVLDAYVRRNLGARMVHVGRAFRSLIGVKGTHSAEAGPPTARLLSIGVDPEWRGQGIAAELVAEYCRELWEDGVERVGLSVRRDNHGAIAFYGATGWYEEGADDTTMRFSRPTVPTARRLGEDNA
jgi:ribosomal protein S18 acetylase RimI-like enzyme